MGDENIETLKAALATANVDLEAATRRLAPKHVGGEMEAYEAALQTVLRAERKLAQAQARPYAVLEDFPLSWDVGAPLPTLLQVDHRTYLFFLLSNDLDGVGIVDFEWCSATSFGSPGDETFEGHPLYGAGFEPYKLMRVIGSPWIEQLRKTDSVHAYHDAGEYSALSHLIFPFHDTTFECVAKSFKCSRVTGSLASAVKAAVDRLF